MIVRKGARYCGKGDISDTSQMAKWWSFQIAKIPGGKCAGACFLVGGLFFKGYSQVCGSAFVQAILKKVH